MDIFNILNRNSIIINTKIINIAIKSILSTDQSFEMFPRNNRVATISESFVLNLQISVPLTNK